LFVYNGEKGFIALALEVIFEINKHLFVFKNERERESHEKKGGVDEIFHQIKILVLVFGRITKGDGRMKDKDQCGDERYQP
jgi:hypothetical protein